MLGERMQTTIDKINCHQMINEILEDGEKLRSLRQLMDRYQLSIPFTAYKARGAGAGQVFEIIEFAKAGHSVATPCSVCGEGVVWACDSVFLTAQTAHEMCDTSAVDAGGWKPDTENWKLA